MFTYLDKNSALLGATAWIAWCNLLTTECLLETSVRGDLSPSGRMLWRWGMPLSVPAHHAQGLSRPTAVLAPAWLHGSSNINWTSPNWADSPEEMLKTRLLLVGRQGLSQGLRQYEIRMRPLAFKWPHYLIRHLKKDCQCLMSLLLSQIFYFCRSLGTTLVETCINSMLPFRDTGPSYKL